MLGTGGGCAVDGKSPGVVDRLEEGYPEFAKKREVQSKARIFIDTSHVSSTGTYPRGETKGTGKIRKQ